MPRLIVIAIAAILTIPLLLMALSGEMDDSWRYAIHKAKLDGLVFGTDIVFTFGPLGYLTYPVYIDRGLWLNTLLFSVATHLLFWGAIYYFLKRHRAGLAGTIYIAAGIVVFMQAITALYSRPNESYYYFYLFIFAYGYVSEKEENITFLGAIAALSALFFYIKFSYAIAVCLMFMAFVLLLAKERRHKEAALGVIFYFSFTVALGLIMIGSPGALAMYFYNSYAIVDGYVDGMAVDGPRWKLLAAVLAWAVYGGFFLLRSIVRKQFGDTRYLVLALGILFVNYKHSAGNGAIFEWDFFATWAIVFSLYYIIRADTGDSRWIKYAALAFSATLITVSVFAFHSTATTVRQVLTSRAAQIQAAVELLKNKNSPMPHELNMQRLSAYYKLSPSTVELLRSHTVDIFTVDAVLAQYYTLKYRPRPTIQSYSAYTAYLDMLNARYLSEKGAPEFVLFAPKEFDSKSALLFEPATYRKILTNYSPVTKDGVFWVLKKRGPAVFARQEDYPPVAASLGSMVNFHVDGRYHMFARIYVKYNILGEIIRVLYRAPNLYIQFYGGGFPLYRYKFCFNAENGIYLNPFANSKEAEKADGFAITTAYPVFFNKHIKVEFFRILAQ
ncbi:MAG: hypothetical protein HQL01_12290 [Nitrospirae bacterium]|nr:hypothetical protein [Nitrospirota bacterium]